MPHSPPAKAGRPRGRDNRVLMAFRLRAPTAELLRKVAGRENLPQARVLEACLYRYAQDLQRGSSPAAATEKPNP